MPGQSPNETVTETLGVTETQDGVSPVSTVHETVSGSEGEDRDKPATAGQSPNETVTVTPPVTETPHARGRSRRPVYVEKGSSKTPPTPPGAEDEPFADKDIDDIAEQWLGCLKRHHDLAHPHRWRMSVVQLSGHKDTLEAIARSDPRAFYSACEAHMRLEQWEVRKGENPFDQLRRLVSLEQQRRNLARQAP